MVKIVAGKDSVFITKEEIIEKFNIPVGKDEDTWSYYRNNVLEIKIVPKEVGPVGEEEETDKAGKGR